GSAAPSPSVVSVGRSAAGSAGRSPSSASVATAPSGGSRTDSSSPPRSSSFSKTEHPSTHGTRFQAPPSRRRRRVGSDGDDPVDELVEPGADDPSPPGHRQEGSPR